MVNVKKSSKNLISNIVPKDKMREFQSRTLETLTDSLINSFGPLGSNTIITKDNALTQYSKDGHTILKNIQFQDIIENSVKSDIEDITRHIVLEIGDGTTSAIILSSIIFEELKKLEKERTPYEIIEDFKKSVEIIKKEIENNVQEFNAEKAYDIALTSTNGNKEVAENIKNIYKEYGNGVFIDVSASTTQDHYLKAYDGMTLEVGYSDTAYITNAKKGCATLRKPAIYAFEDPIDTSEMISLLNAIITNNIMAHYQSKDRSVPQIPTVILAPTISRDMSAYIEQIVDFMYKFPEGQRPPLLIISNIKQREQYFDIARMCGCKFIKKYIDPRLQEEDIKKGLAPTPETIINFGGQVDIVEADVCKTKFVNPALMHNKNGELSQTFNTLLEFLKAELKKAKENGEDANVTGNLKRRINALQANMVEYLVGGISMSDRDSLRDLVEDAVLNCRSAAKYGVGYGANVEGYLSSMKVLEKENNDINKIILESYNKLLNILYRTAFSEEKVYEIMKCLHDKPFNIKTKQFDKKVLCSIKADIVILDAISQIISLMFTSNQFLCPTFIQNRYLTL